MPLISVFNHAGFMALIALFSGQSPSVVARDQMHKHDDSKQQHSKKSRQSVASLMEMDAATLDLATEKMLTEGNLKARIASQTTLVRINHKHAWILTTKGHGGNPISEATISVDGGIPTYGHGLPATPWVTKEAGNGKYLIEV